MNDDPLKTFDNALARRQSKHKSHRRNQRDRHGGSKCCENLRSKANE
jgi:hypothetical protein